MPQPSRSQVHVDAVLSNLSTAYIQDDERFIATKVFPLVPVTKASDLYYTYDKDDWFRDEAQKRADASESAGSGYDLSSDSYACETYAFHKDIGAQARRNADSPIQLDAEATRFVTQRILLRQEVDFVTKFFGSGIWATDVTGTDDVPKWSNYTTSDPVEDVETGKALVLSTTGFEANTLVLGYNVFRRLKNHPDVRDRYKHTTADVVTAEMLARLFDIERVVISKSVVASGPEKQDGSSTFGFTAGNNALLAHVATAPGLLTPSAGYTFGWDGVSGGLGTPVAVSSWFNEDRKADRVEAESAWDHKVVATDLGYFFDDIA
jgi:hypothetical protein